MAKGLLYCLLGWLLLLSGCAKNTVPLIYPAMGSQSIPAVEASSICIVKFADLRSQPAVGVRSDSSAFLPSSDVGDWFTHVLASELMRQGFAVRIASTEEQAEGAKTKYVLTGTIRELWMTEHSMTSYDTTMRATVVMKRNFIPLVNNTFSSTLSKQVLSFSNAPKELLAECATDLAKTVARAVREKVPN